MASRTVHDWDSGEVGTKTLMRAGPYGWIYDTPKTTDSTTDSTEIAVDNTGALTIADSRKLRITISGRVQCDNAGAQVIGNLKRDGAQIAQALRFIAANASDMGSFCFVATDNPGASGTYGYSFTFYRAAGTGNVHIRCAADAPFEFIIEDIGST